MVNVPQYIGEEVFGLAKRRPHVELGTDDESHRFEKIKIPHPKTLTKALKMKLHGSPLVSAKHNLEVDVLLLSAWNQTSNVVEPVHHVIILHENDCDVQQWHIHRVPFVGKKLALQCMLELGKNSLRRYYCQFMPLHTLGFYMCRARTKNSNNSFNSSLIILQGASTVLDASG